MRRARSVVAWVWTCACLQAAVAGELAGQVRGPAPAPDQTYLWAGGSIGFMQPFTIRDGSTRSTWSFGSSTPFRLSLERSIDPINAIGVAGMLATVPMTYQSEVPTGGCTRCEVDATLRQVMLTFKNTSGGWGLLRVFELGAGMTGFSDFKAQDGTAGLGPQKVDWDFTMSVGYGLGFRIQQTMEIVLQQDLWTVVHQRAGLAGSDNSLPRIGSTRLGMRYRF